VTLRQRHILNARRSGFTLIELLVVIAIITLLLSLVVGGGIALLRNQKTSVTQNVLYSLDRALDEYITVSSGGGSLSPPPYDPEDYADVPGEALTGDGRFGENRFSNAFAFPEYPAGARKHPRFPDAAVFLRQASGYGAVDDILAAIPDRFLFITRRGSRDEALSEDLTPSVIDSWSDEEWNAPWPLLEQQVIYYVHPSNTAAQALYGRCDANRPYFMSAGPDKKYGNAFEVDALTEDGPTMEQAESLLEDNLYSTPGVKGTHRPDLSLRMQQPES